MFGVEVGRPWVAEARFAAVREEAQNPSSTDGGSWSVYRRTAEATQSAPRLVSVHNTTWEQLEVRGERRGGAGAARGARAGSLAVGVRSGLRDRAERREGGGGVVGGVVE